MNRTDADKHVEKIKKLCHLDVDAYKHIAKLFEYVLFELDGLKDREADLPSVYGSWHGEPLYKDYVDERDEDPATACEVELPDVPEMVELAEVEKINDDTLDDRNIPMVLAYDASLTPFPVATAENDEKKADKPAEGKAPETVSEKAPRDNNDDKNGVSNSQPDQVKPKRLKVVGEGEKKALHSSSLKRVKESLRDIRKKERNVSVEIVKE